MAVYSAVTLLLAYSALLVAAFSAVALALRERGHRPVAVALVTLLLASLARAALNRTILFPPGPYHGWVRAAFHVEEALWLLSPAALAWLPARVLVFPSERVGPWGLSSRAIADVPVLILWASWVIPVVAGYPTLHGAALGHLYLAAQVVGLVLAAGSVVSWARRGGWRDLSPTVLCVLAMVLCALADLLVGGWRYGLYGAAYEPTQAILALLYAVLTVVQLGALLTSRRA